MRDLDSHVERIHPTKMLSSECHLIHGSMETLGIHSVWVARWYRYNQMDTQQLLTDIHMEILHHWLLCKSCIHFWCILMAILHLSLSKNNGDAANIHSNPRRNNLYPMSYPRMCLCIYRLLCMNNIWLQYLFNKHSN